jgi:Mrp family chromosome partitioning ATPase
MTHLLRQLEAEYDYVILDSAPLLPVTDGAIVATAADVCVVVVAHGRTEREHVRRSAQTLTNVGAHLVGAVLNMAPSGSAGGGYYDSQYYSESEPNGRHRQAEGQPTVASAARAH